MLQCLTAPERSEEGHCTLQPPGDVSLEFPLGAAAGGMSAIGTGAERKALVTQTVH